MQSMKLHHSHVHKKLLKDTFKEALSPFRVLFNISKIHKQQQHKTNVGI